MMHSASSKSDSAPGLEDRKVTQLPKHSMVDEWTVFRYLAYGTGHVLNDMCASTWFSYLLIFLHHAVKLSPKDSAIVMFSGQIADGIATPLVGIFSDQSNNFPILGLQRRKFWLAMGAVIVIICFYFVFAVCAPYWFTQKPSRTLLVTYYSIAAALFNCGWAAVQVSHMALVPELSKDDNVRCALTSIRYAFTIVSNVLVFCIFFALLHLEKPYNRPDKNKFTHLAWFSLVIGGGCVCFFLYGTKERAILEQKTSVKHIAEPNSQSGNKFNLPRSGFDKSDIRPITQIASGTYIVTSQRMRWTDWFRERMFYEVGLVYMCTRLVVNLTQVYISLFLLITLDMYAASIAIIPLLLYLSGFFAALLSRTLNRKLGRADSYLLGTFLVVIALSSTYALTPISANYIYICTIILGMGNAIIMVSSVCLEADLVGNNVESGAFAYGAMSFTDKAYFEKDANFLRFVVCVLPSIFAIIGAITVASMRYWRFSIHDEKKRDCLSGKKMATDAGEDTCLFRGTSSMYDSI